jgi:hypothetical protein
MLRRIRTLAALTPLKGLKFFLCEVIGEVFLSPAIVNKNGLCRCAARYHESS